MRPLYLLLTFILCYGLFFFSLGCTYKKQVSYKEQIGTLVISGSDKYNTSARVIKKFKFFSPTKPENITVGYDKATIPYIPVADLFVNSCDIYSNISKEKLIQALQIKAAQLGADMVVNFRFSIIYSKNSGIAYGMAIKTKSLDDK